MWSLEFYFFIFAKQPFFGIMWTRVQDFQEDSGMGSTPPKKSITFLFHVIFCFILHRVFWSNKSICWIICLFLALGLLMHSWSIFIRLALLPAAFEFTRILRKLMSLIVLTLCKTGRALIVHCVSVLRAALCHPGWIRILVRRLHSKSTEKQTCLKGKGGGKFNITVKLYKNAQEGNCLNQVCICCSKETN